MDFQKNIKKPTSDHRTACRKIIIFYYFVNFFGINLKSDTTLTRQFVQIVVQILLQQLS